MYQIHLGFSHIECISSQGPIRGIPGSYDQAKPTAALDELLSRTWPKLEEAVLAVHRVEATLSSKEELCAAVRTNHDCTEAH